MNQYRVYDDRTDETLFKSSKEDCLFFIKWNYEEDDDDFEHIFIEPIK
ncbi:hypothetical protein KM895_02975 [Bacillus pumilus]|nr:hypothetical protein [Bacillus pumilus]MBU8637683.1 hypothetical protein [Bacillus pumilus]